MKALLPLLLLCCTLLQSAPLKIVSAGTSSYRVVLPDLPGDESRQHLERAGKLLCSCIKGATGVAVPLITESERPEGAPAILIGQTKALQAAGFDTASLKTWEHRILVRGKDVFLFGHDRYYPKTNQKASDYHTHELGSAKAVFAFLQKFVSTEVVRPGSHGVSTLPMEAIEVPEDFSFSMVPQIQYVTGRAQNFEYDLANNLLRCPWYGTYGGHSHPVAIPPEKYSDTHPEYFIEVKGERQPKLRVPHYCLSNREVQELIYQELLNHLDQGYEMVQLGQSDGFRACQCEECKKMYGVESYGEKIWILHRAMAERLKKDRPGKMLCIMAYGPTNVPPQTFRDFPDNVMIELAPFNDKIVASWQGYSVPKGFVVYLYNWGWYHMEGFTPKRTASWLSRQVAQFHANNIRGVYCCGFGELMGTEGPAYFQWCRQLENPELDAKALRQLYLRHAYRECAPVMAEFFNLLEQRLALDIDRSQDWNDPALLEGTMPALHDNMRILAMRYPDEVLDKLYALLQKAESMEHSPKAEPFLQYLRLEVEYQRLTCKAVNAFRKFRQETTSENYQPLLQLLLARKQFIDDLPKTTKSTPEYIRELDGVRLFGYCTTAELRENGRLRAPLRIPFTWDARWMQANGIQPAGRVLHADGSRQLLVQKDFYQQNPEIANDPAEVSALWDAENLHVTFHFPKSDLKAVYNDEVQVFLGRDGYRSWNPARAHRGQSNQYVRLETSVERKGLGDKYGEPAGKKVLASITTSGEGEEAAVTLHVPWAVLPGFTPAKGAHLEFNATRGKDQIKWIWEQNISQNSWRNMQDAMGTIVLD